MPHLAVTVLDLQISVEQRVMWLCFLFVQGLTQYLTDEMAVTGNAQHPATKTVAARHARSLLSLPTLAREVDADGCVKQRTQSLLDRPEPRVYGGC